jgi:flagellar secretion chaperone FliS
MNRNGIKAYASVQLETGVNSASPQKLISLLYRGLLDNLKQAIQAIQLRDYETKARSIDKASRILTEGLRASLNFDQGGDIAENLFDLYNFVNDEMFRGSVRNSVESLELCVSIIDTIASAWNEAIESPEAKMVDKSAAKPATNLIEAAKRLSEIQERDRVETVRKDIEAVASAGTLSGAAV